MRRTHRYGDHPDQHGELFLPPGEPRNAASVENMLIELVQTTAHTPQMQ